MVLKIIRSLDCNKDTNPEELQAYITFACLWEIFEKVTFDSIFEHFAVNLLLTPNQSGFHTGDSSINQLLYITHRNCAAFEEFPSREYFLIYLKHLTKSGMTV